jgi:transposase-like protein
LALLVCGKFRIALKNTPGNYRLFIILLRLITFESTGKEVFTYQYVADYFGYKARQDVNNFFRIFVDAGCDFCNYLVRKSYLSDAFGLVEEQILGNVLLPLHEHYRIFMERHKSLEMCYATFTRKVDQIRTSLVISAFMKVFSDRVSSNGIDLMNTLALISKVKDKNKIIDPLLKQSNAKYKFDSKYGETSFKPSLDRVNLSLLVNFLSASGLSFEIIGMLLNVSKTTAHNLFHNLQDLQSMLINSIKSWSGKISIDEKYIKINQIPHYVITIVDFITGIPLYMDIYPDTKTETYQHCFEMFKQFYGIPRLIVSDGSKSLFKARELVFPTVVYQLCKFHKMKNLFREMAKTLSRSSFEKYKPKVVKIFRRQTTAARKKGLIALTKVLPMSLGKYIKEGILDSWRARAKGLTSNVSERFNRKIKKAVSGRFGLKSLDTARQIVFSLWVKELILRGSSQLHEESTIFNLNITDLCQEMVDLKHVELLFTKKLNKAEGY